MEKLFSALHLNLLVPLVFPSIQNMLDLDDKMRDLDHKILSGNICYATWHLCLLPTLAKGCMLFFQPSCNQIATNRQTLWRRWGGFLSGFLFTPWITAKAVHTQSFGCALVRGWRVFSLSKEAYNHFRLPP